MQVSTTPALVYDAAELKKDLCVIRPILEASGASLLYALKACSIHEVVRSTTALVDGFACSSLFEARLSDDVLRGDGSIHFASPGMRPDELEAIAKYCDYVSFNSLPQWERHGARFAGKVSCGLRINPGLSFVEDSRYDPCRASTKLGASLEHVKEFVEDVPQCLKGIDGVHFHSNCDSTDLSELSATVDRLEAEISALLSRVEWINLGGGYDFTNAENVDELHRAIDCLQSKYGLTVFLEPGAAIVRSAGYLVASVLDLFVSDGKTVAILDTTVNHMPEVYEYQFEPDVLGHEDGAPHEYILAGCTCLAGDIFGEYSFAAPLEVGSQVVFANCGAYTLAKAHWFNGVNLPSVYFLSESGKLELIKKYSYDDFANNAGATPRVSV